MQALGIDRLGFETGQTIRALNTTSRRLGGPSAVGPSAVKLASRALLNNNARAADVITKQAGIDWEFLGMSHASVKVFKLTCQNEGWIVDKFSRPVHLSVSFQN